MFTCHYVVNYVYLSKFNSEMVKYSNLARKILSQVRHNNKQ